MKKIPQATRGPQGAADITVSGNTILITNLEIHDADAADELRDLPDEQRAQATARAFKVGYAALRQAGVTVNIDYIQREMERLISRVDEANEEAIDVVKAVLKANFADEEGRLPRTLEAYFGDRGSVRGFLDDLFDDGRRDSAIGKISTLLTASYAFVNQDLAPLYDVAAPSGGGFVKTEKFWRNNDPLGVYQPGDMFYVDDNHPWMPFFPVLILAPTCFVLFLVFVAWMAHFAR